MRGLDARCDLALTYVRTRDLGRAAVVLGEATAAFAASLGPEHPQTLCLRGGMGSAGEFPIFSARFCCDVGIVCKALQE